MRTSLEAGDSVMLRGYCAGKAIGTSDLESAGHCAFSRHEPLSDVLADFWQIVCTRLDARSRVGRFKQWLNFFAPPLPQG
ncbi:hypothetical protein LP416_03515 [Polaromonas sp. P2-4]|nr:hypothetical protein LP416_03515 [Polaromonas sp. P2-4]